MVYAYAALDAHMLLLCLLFSVELSFLRLEPTGRVPFANDDHSDAISITENFVFGNSNQEVVYVCNSSLCV